MLKQEAGLTLIEVLIATVILTVGIVGTFGLLNTSTKTSAQTHDREGAVSLAREILEDAHTIPFDQISPTSVTSDLQEMTGLENATPTEKTWHLVRGTSGTQAGTTYTVTVHACYIDSPKDGLAKTAELGGEAANYCEKHEGNEEWKEKDEVDLTPIDFKRVTVKVSWQATNRTPYVEETALLGAAGESTSLNVSELKLVEPPTPSCEAGKTGAICLTEPTITTSVSELTFSVCAPKSSTGMLWSLGGVLQASSSEVTSTTCKSGEGYVWKFKWKIEGLSDGTYEVSAQATTTTGVLGPPVTIPVTLIRGAPASPKGVKGGFNEVYASGVLTKVIELEWEANSERNVIGYRVYSPSGLVCPSSESTLSTSLSCIEFKRNYEPASSPIYKVVALYRNSKEEVKEGTPESFPLKALEAPKPPTNLKCEGNATLTWTAPTSGTPVAFYRIYRDSKNYTGRYDTASSTATRYEDAEPGVSKHQYWITAVNQTLTESTFEGPKEC